MNPHDRDSIRHTPDLFETLGLLQWHSDSTKRLI